jgi:hypothetical protein
MADVRWRVFIPIEGTPFLYALEHDMPVVEIPTPVPLGVDLGVGVADPKFSEPIPPSRKFHRLEIRHGLNHHTYVYAQSGLNPATFD